MLLPGVLAEVLTPPLEGKLPAGLVSTPSGVAWKIPRHARGAVTRQRRAGQLRAGTLRVVLRHLKVPSVFETHDTYNLCSEF